MIWAAMAEGFLFLSLTRVIYESTREPVFRYLSCYQRFTRSPPASAMEIEAKIGALLQWVLWIRVELLTSVEP